jgi:hypothetical protein
MPSRKSNDITLKAYNKYPDRFIPFGHVRPVDREMQSELMRIGKESKWKGLKLHQGEFPLAIDELLWPILEMAQESGIRICIFHCAKFRIADEISMDFPKITFIFTHLGRSPNYSMLSDYCAIAKQRENVYLDTSVQDHYEVLSEAVKMAGADKLTFGSDGCVHSPLVELTKIKTLKLPKTEEDLILGGNISRILEL